MGFAIYTCGVRYNFVAICPSGVNGIYIISYSQKVNISLLQSKNIALRSNILQKLVCYNAASYIYDIRCIICV